MGIPLSSLNPKARTLVEQAMASLHEVGPKPAAPTRTGLFVVAIEPMGKPRMTQRDKWAKRPCVLRYREYADTLRAACEGIAENPTSVSWRAFFTMPKSWSAKKRAKMAGKLHRSKPDRDNVDKGILDALWAQDSGIARGTLEKRWDDGSGARLEITVE